MSEEDHHDGGGGFNMGSIQSMGIINALKTGDPKLDTILALLMPFALNFLLQFAVKVTTFLKDAWTKWWTPQGRITKYHERTITHRSQFNSEEGYTMDVDEDDAKNGVLLKAIRLYLHANVDLSLTRADMTLMEAERVLGRRNNYGSTFVDTLRSYKILKNPPVNEWHKLGLYGSKAPVQVELKVESGDRRNDGDGGDGDIKKHNVKERKYVLRSLKGDAIDAFIETAYEWYIEELRKSEGTAKRYYYELQSQPLGIADRRGRQQRRYTRFELSSEKTFGSLFFPERDSILKLVESFMKKEGKYAIKGYPHKLGILLHGPPGTGKTSFIKALAEYTGRNIVNVPLAKIGTNAELTAMFFDKKYECDDYVNISMDFEDVIFVMEDIDAASDVVKRRDGKKTAEVIKTSHIDLPPPKSLWHMMLESEDESCKKLVQILVDKSERLKEEASNPEVLRAAAKRLAALPALGFVGESQDKTLEKLSEDAISSSEKLMRQCNAVDTFLGFHAKRIERLVDEGADIEVLVNELLGIEQHTLPPMLLNRPSSRPLSRDVSYSKYNGSDKVYMEMVELKEALTKSAMLGQTAQSNVQGTTTGMPNAPQLGSTKSPYRGFLKKEDELNLSGILNVLDGVVDTPARIVVMTTNHPEHLDPALVRPGRIDKKLRLGYMAGSEISDMLEHYFETTLDESQRLRIESIIEGEPSEDRPKLNLTPAQVEQFTVEYESVDAMIRALEEKAFLIPTATCRPRSGTVSSAEMTFGI